MEILVAEEKLNAEETRKYLSNAFQDGYIKTSGTDIDKIMPPVSRFDGGVRAKKQQVVIDKLRAFFEKYYGLTVVDFQEQSCIFEKQMERS